ncbi:MAG: flagellar protein FlaG [Candidatus Hydrogenedentota bacterium]
MAVEGVTPPGPSKPSPSPVRGDFPRAGPDGMHTRETVHAKAKPQQAAPRQTIERPETVALAKPRPKRAGMRLSIDEQTKRIVAKIVDETNRVIKQIPPEEILRIIAQGRKVRAQMFNEVV